MKLAGILPLRYKFIVTVDLASSATTKNSPSPWQVAKEGKGYIEDRRPNANRDPYTVTRLMTETVCSSAMVAV